MKADLSKRFSQATSKAVMEELLRFDVPPKPKSPSGPGTAQCEYPSLSSNLAYSITLS